MNGSNGLLDSNVIIDASKNLIDIKEIIESYSMLSLSIISYIEILGFPFENHDEKSAIMNILAKIPVANLNMDIAHKAIQYRTGRKIKLPDALILATASFLKSDLVTSNKKDFKNVDPSIKLVIPQKIRIVKK